MKTLLKTVGIIGIIVSIVFALYGSVKLARANDILTDPRVYELLMAAAKNAFTAAGFLFVGSITLLVVGGKSK